MIPNTKIGVCCPNCEGTNIIRRGIRKTKTGNVQVYGCNSCKKRFSVQGDETTRDDTVACLKEANTILLRNNVIISEENHKLRNEIKTLRADADYLQEKINSLSTARDELVKKNNICKQNCEIALSEKNRVIKEKEQYIANCRTTFERLRDGKWSYRIEQQSDGQIRISHFVVPG
jgi:transposase-like protein